MTDTLPVTVQLIADAIERHGEINITPCRHDRFRDALTENGGDFKLWYNTSDYSTHVVKRPKKK